MKELAAHIKEEIKVHAENQQEKQRVYDGSLQRHPGQFVWQVDLKTQLISKVKFSEESANFTGGVTKNIVRKEGHWYCVAINEKNAFRKFNNMAKEFIEKIKPTTT